MDLDTLAKPEGDVDMTSSPMPGIRAGGWPRRLAFLSACALTVGACAPQDADRRPADGAVRAQPSHAAEAPAPDVSLPADNPHARFGSAIPPVARVASGAVVEAFTQEASAGQITLESSAEVMTTIDFDPIHPLTGPVFVEGAEPGDILAVTLHEVEVMGWGWTGIVPGFGFLADEFPEPWLRTFEIAEGATHVDFGGGVRIPLRPFPGVMGVAPATEEMLSTIPPRANGGNMDDKDIVAGTTVYFPVFVDGALFSIGDAHAAQGDGEVSGTALESPMRIVYQVEVIKGGRSIQEPQYETEDAYTVTAFGETLDEAARKATRYMIDYLESDRGMSRTEGYVLTSLAGEMEVAEVVDVPHVLVKVRMPKAIFGG
jgi:acetamidase/formamidase